MRYTLEIKLVHLSLLKSVFILDYKLEIFILSITIQSCRKLFYGEGMRGGEQSKSVNQHGWQNRNDLKSHICNFFWKYYMGHTTFIYSSKSSSGHQSFFCTAPFLDAQELDSWSTLKSNVWIFMYISIRKLLLQRRSKILFGEKSGLGGGWGRGWIISLKQLTVWVS